MKACLHFTNFLYFNIKYFRIPIFSFNMFASWQFGRVSRLRVKSRSVVWSWANFKLFQYLVRDWCHKQIKTIWLNTSADNWLVWLSLISQWWSVDDELNQENLLNIMVDRRHLSINIDSFNDRSYVRNLFILSLKDSIKISIIYPGWQTSAHRHYPQVFRNSTFMFLLDLKKKKEIEWYYNLICVHLPVMRQMPE